MATWLEFRKYVPNLLTAGRGVIGPPTVLALYYLWGYAGWQERLVIAATFAAAAVTDYYDGKWAKKWGCKSKLGAFLDPHSDKLLSWAALIILWEQLQLVAPLLLILLAIILAYDVSTSLARVLEALGFRIKLVTSQTARERTFILQGTLTAFLLGEFVHAVFDNPIVGVFIGAMLTAAFLTALVWTFKSAYEYLAPYFGRATIPS